MKQSLPVQMSFILTSLFFLQAGYGAEVINAGVGGNTTADLLRRVEKAVISREPTAVVVMAGTNDRLNSRKFVSAESYRKNIVRLVRRIEESGASILLVTPPPCLESLLMTRHEPAKFSDLSPNGRMLEVRKILLGVSEAHKVPLVDLHDHLVKNKLAGADENSVLKNPDNGGGNDGVHLTSRGYRIMAELVAGTIRSQKLDPSKIICFGDSITFGAGMRGAGTAEGETYPAYLKILLNDPVGRPGGAEDGR